jgi:hypothetical protein
MAASKAPGKGAPGNEGTAMTDLLMIVFTIVFFALALIYVAACEKLR